MIIQMRKLGQEAMSNSSNLSKLERVQVEDMILCADAAGYSPTWGQIEFLQEMVKKGVKKAEKFKKFGGKAQESSEKAKKLS